MIFDSLSQMKLAKNTWYRVRKGTYTWTNSNTYMNRDPYKELIPVITWTFKCTNEAAIGKYFSTFMEIVPPTLSQTALLEPWGTNYSPYIYIEYSWWMASISGYN